MSHSQVGPAPSMDSSVHPPRQHFLPNPPRHRSRLHSPSLSFTLNRDTRLKERWPSLSRYLMINELVISSTPRRRKAGEDYDECTGLKRDDERGREITAAPVHEATSA
ncbi:hypothetical protein DPEC_G00330440 [Dallia pectoralis]|uniref:Uncharacterized protein n=1 Tax=Dallia pectoralis TaxID=75939 RepID=A0ACC2F8T5_DALPE|nr:hypothetical protein DPEC_G00330440 [Dallia pectoralis]